MMRLAVSAVVAGAACLTLVNPVTFTRSLGAPTLPARADNCPVEIYEDGQPFAKAHKLLGHVVVEWSATQLKEQGIDKALRTLKNAACDVGAHAVINMRALPRGFNEGMIYEGDVVALLDDQGEPLLGKATGTAESHGGIAPQP